MPPLSFSKFFSLVRAHVLVAVNASNVWRYMSILCISIGDSGFNSSRYWQHLYNKSFIWDIHRKLKYIRVIRYCLNLSISYYFMEMILIFKFVIKLTPLKILVISIVFPLFYIMCYIIYYKLINLNILFT